MHPCFVLILGMTTQNNNNSINQDLIEVPTDLFNKIMLRIDKQKRCMVIRRFSLISGFLLLILVALVPVWRSFQFDISQSGFDQYISLLFYDFNFIITEWQNFSLSLLESLPIISTIELLSVVFVLLLVIKSEFKYGKILFNHSHT
jgi:hypothetical protein